MYRSVLVDQVLELLEARRMKDLGFEEAGYEEGVGGRSRLD